ncbi:MAG: 23S rRNA (guanosine(2251)-2'-O)-methyltransferase RlmB [Pseudomonadota bacterium]
MAQRSKKKPDWIINKERARKARNAETIWLFGLHAVRDALSNPMRDKHALIVTQNAFQKLQSEIAAAGIDPQVVDARKFDVPIDPNSVHQGAAIEVTPLDWGDLTDICAPRGQAARVVCLDRVSDPHNVGAILRSAEVFGARAVIATQRHAAPETGALAKTASGALERQPYIRVRNLAQTLRNLQEMGYYVLGMDGTADAALTTLTQELADRPIALVLGAEGPGLRDLTKETCDQLVKIDYANDFGSLNVSNAAAVALYGFSLPQ